MSRTPISRVPLSTRSSASVTLGESNAASTMELRKQLAARSLASLNSAADDGYYTHYAIEALYASPDNPRRELIDETAIYENLDALKRKPDEPFEAWSQRLDTFESKQVGDVKDLVNSIFTLARSISVHNLQQPIIAEQTKEITAGECRWIACQLAGIDKTRVIIRAKDDESRVAVYRLIENMHRKDLNVPQTVKAVRNIAERTLGGCRLDNELLSTEGFMGLLGVGRTTAAAYLAFARLPEDDAVLNLIYSGQCSSVRDAYQLARERVKALNNQDASAPAIAEKPIRPSSKPRVNVAVNINSGMKRFFEVLSNSDILAPELNQQLEVLVKKWDKADHAQKRALITDALKSIADSMADTND